MIWRSYISLLLIVLLTLGFVAWSAQTDLPAQNLQELSLPPSQGHPLGTSPDGRDLLHLCSSLAIKAVGESLWPTVLTVAIGLLVGFSAAGLRGRVFDRMQSCLAKLFDSIGPFIFAACFGALAPRIGTWKLGICLALVSWPSVSSIVRAEAIRLSKLAYVEAARVVGVHPFRIATVHLLPPMLDRLGPLWIGIYTGYLALFGAIDFIGVRISSEQSLGFAIFESTGFLRSNVRYFATCFGTFLLVLLVSTAAPWAIRQVSRWLARRATA